MGVKSNWHKKLEKRTENIGFLSRLNAFREPTEFEKAQALAIEINSWQATKGTKTFTVSAEYSKPIEHLKHNWDHLQAARKAAGRSYIETPMDAGPNIDVSQYKPKTLKQRMLMKIKLYAPQVVAVSTLLIGIYLILKGMK